MYTLCSYQTKSSPTLKPPCPTSAERYEEAGRSADKQQVCILLYIAINYREISEIQLALVFWRVLTDCRPMMALRIDDGLIYRQDGISSRGRQPCPFMPFSMMLVVPVAVALVIG